MDAYFEKTNLKNAVLARANIEGVRFGKTNLEEAILVKANLKGARLAETNLKRAILLEANLEEAISFRTNLNRADLEKAKLRGACLVETDLRMATRLTIEQLSEAKTLYKIKLDSPLLKQIKENYPHLLEKPEYLEQIEGDW